MCPWDFSPVETPTFANSTANNNINSNKTLFEKTHGSDGRLQIAVILGSADHRRTCHSTGHALPTAHHHLVPVDAAEADARRREVERLVSGLGASNPANNRRRPGLVEPTR